LRSSTQFIFDDCPIPVYPLPGRPDTTISLCDLEAVGRSGMTKDIPLFFHGRTWVRLARLGISHVIEEKIPGCHIGFTDRGDFVTSSEYINLLSRAKIAWCPRSCWSYPDKECNGSTGREVEAMCVESMVLKHSIGTTEVEKREPGVHFVQIGNQNEDIIEKIQYYLEHDDERKEIAHNGKLYFERNLSMAARMRYILNKCLESMKEN